LKTILVIDDDFAMRRGIAFMLKGEGYTVLEATDDTRALEIIATNCVHLAILDLFLPGRDGIDLAHEIYKHNAGMPILLITAHGEHERGNLARKIFKDYFLDKSTLSNELIAKVRKILG
jgi:DNA-binding response OmpR family regulator